MKKPIVYTYITTVSNWMCKTAAYLADVYLVLRFEYFQD